MMFCFQSFPNLCIVLVLVSSLSSISLLYFSRSSASFYFREQRLELGLGNGMGFSPNHPIDLLLFPLAWNHLSFPSNPPKKLLKISLFVFVLSFFVECLSHVKFGGEKGSSPVIVGLVQALVHGLRVGLAYMIMLAVMSFNGGVFLVAVVGHALGFFVFGTNLVFKKGPVVDDTHSDLSPMICV